MRVCYLLIKRKKLFGQSNTLKEEETKEKCFLLYIAIFNHFISMKVIKQCVHFRSQ